MAISKLQCILSLKQDVLSVVDLYGDQVYFINKLNGQEFTRPYSRQQFREEIWGICMYDSESQPIKTGNMYILNKITNASTSFLLQRGKQTKTCMIKCALAHSFVHYEILSMQNRDFLAMSNEFFSVQTFFSCFWSKHRLRVHVRTSLGEAILLSTHNLCFGAKIRQIGTLYTSVLLYKSGVHGVYNTRTCFRDVT